METAKFKNFDSGLYTVFAGPAQIEKDLNNLLGLIKGIGADGHINQMEVERLKRWLSEVVGYRDNSPYRDVRLMIEEILEDGKVDHEELLDLEWLCEQFLNKENPYFNVVTRGVQQLSGILSGIEADDNINDSELLFLKNYVDSHGYLKNTWPYDEVLSLVNAIVEDKYYSGEILGRLRDITKSTSVLGSVTSNKDTIESMAVTTATADLVTLTERSFCITGNSSRYSRHEIAQMIELYGGYVQDSVSGKLNYLVVCDEKNACWAFASYGRKIEKVKALQSKGKTVEIIYEEDLYLTIENIKTTTN